MHNDDLKVDDLRMDCQTTQGEGPPLELPTEGRGHGGAAATEEDSRFAYAGLKLLIDTTRSDNPGALFRQAPGIPYQLIEGSSHWVQLDKPQDLTNLLDAFLGDAR